MDLADVPLALARAVHLLSSSLVAGTLLFGSVVAEPAFGSVAGHDTALSDRFRRRSTRLVACALLLALASGAAWLVLLAQQIGEQPLAEALRDTAWTLLTQTQFGTVWQFRFACAMALGVLAFASMRRGVRRTGVLSGIALVVSVLFVGALAWSGHGGATPGRAGYIHAAADVLHLIAAAAWVGGLVPLVMLIVLGAADGPDRVITTDALRRFSSLGVITVATILATGVVNSWLLVGGLDGLTDTGYGRLLLLKIALFLIMLAFAALNRERSMPRLAADAAGPAEQSSSALDDIRRNAVAEIALGAIVFLIVGFLGLLEPAVHAHGHVH